MFFFHHPQGVFLVTWWRQDARTALFTTRPQAFGITSLDCKSMASRTQRWVMLRTGLLFGDFLVNFIWGYFMKKMVYHPHVLWSLGGQIWGVFSSISTHEHYVGNALMTNLNTRWTVEPLTGANVNNSDPRTKNKPKLGMAHHQSIADKSAECSPSWVKT